MGWATLLGFGGLGAAIISWTQPYPFYTLFVKGDPWYLQLAIGLGYGALAAVVALFIVSRPFMANIRTRYSKLFAELRLNLGQILFLSFCAGVGEELFFRAALQPLLGLWPTSILFVALHGYLDPRSWKMSVYGVSMTVVIAGMGWLFEEVGLLAAIAAHAGIDVILLLFTRKGANN